MEEIINLFGQGFFPVIMAAAMFWYIVRISDQHKEEINVLKQSIDGNTVAMVELREMMRPLLDKLNKEE